MFINLVAFFIGPHICLFFFHPSLSHAPYLSFENILFTLYNLNAFLRIFGIQIPKKYHEKNKKNFAMASSLAKTCI